MNTIAVIDYGMGNLHSVAKALEKAGDGVKAIISSKPEEILAADRVILPGVGAIRDCMREIRRLGFDQVVLEAVKSKPVLGICVGMQAMMEYSEENGGVECLGVFPGKVRFFGNELTENGERLKVPHMGWNEVYQQGSHPLWKDIPDGSRFYFVHSYYVDGTAGDIVAGVCRYGVSLAAAVQKDNVFATQFHPEKSQHAGLALLKNFVSWDGTR